MITAIVKNSLNAAIPNQAVTFGASSGTLLAVSTATDDNGVATAKLTQGTDKTNRSIVVRVSSGDVSGSLTIPVVGSRVTIGGDGSLLLSATSKPYTVMAFDSAGVGVAGVKLTMTSAQGGTIAPASLVTDAAGKGVFTYSPKAVGIDTLSVSGLGATAQMQVTVAPRVVVFQGLDNGALLEVNQSQTVSVLYADGANPIAGAPVTFTTSRGAFVGPNTVTTNAQGIATVQVQADTAGPATLTASVIGSTSASLDVAFVSSVPASIALQANPNAVAPNAVGSSSSASMLSVVVRDAKGNPVQGARVGFSAEDPSGGSISPSIATTDSSGTATSSFVAGRQSTGANAVLITANLVSNPAIKTTTTLTVNAAALFITIGTGNEIEVVNTTTFKQPYTLYVTDSTGAPVKSQTVVLQMVPTQYGKGWYEVPYITTMTSSGATTTTRGDRWVQRLESTCANEDVNLNGMLDAGEDTNGNGRLDPGAPAVIMSSATGVSGAIATVTTDANGFALFELRYAKQYATWAEVQLIATARVAGTESKAGTQPVWLPGLASDYTNIDVSPPGAVSPYGQASSCSSPN